MNIFATNGHKVICSQLESAYPNQLKEANELLEVGKVYVVDHTEIGNYHTSVYLKEFPNTYFNSVFFEDLYPENNNLLNDMISFAQLNDNQLSEDIDRIRLRNKEYEKELNDTYGYLIG